MTARRYAMTRLGAGDYLLPSNDRLTLWRLHRYQEDGTQESPSGRPNVGWYWSVYRYTEPLALLTPTDLMDGTWTRWECVALDLATRQEAIEEALSLH